MDSAGYGEWGQRLRRRGGSTLTRLQYDKDTQSGTNILKDEIGSEKKETLETIVLSYETLKQ